MARASRRGDATRSERRRAAVHRRRQLAATRTAAAAPADTDYVDACLTSAGLILEEVTVVDGKLAARLTATELELDPPLDPAAFAVEGERVGPDQGGAAVTEIDGSAAPAASYWALEAPTSGRWARAPS